MTHDRRRRRSQTAIEQSRATFLTRLHSADISLGPRLTSLFGTLRRVHRLEGWAGLYKGWVAGAMMATALFAALYLLLAVGYVTGMLPVKDSVDSFGFFVALFVIDTTLIPAEVVFSRAVVTPYTLPTSIGATFRILLTDYERRRPWTLYLPLLIPSVALFAARLGPIALVAALLRPRAHPKEIWRVAAILPVAALAALWTTPLAVAKAKIMVQQDFGPTSEEAKADDSEDPLLEDAQDAVDALPARAPRHTLVVDDLQRAATGDEDVIHLRTNARPYAGLVDALRTIRAEEGKGALFRTWAWTAVGQVLNAPY